MLSRRLQEFVSSSLYQLTIESQNEVRWVIVFSVWPYFPGGMVQLRVIVKTPDESLSKGRKVEHFN